MGIWDSGTSDLHCIGYRRVCVFPMLLPQVNLLIIRQTLMLSVETLARLPSGGKVLVAIVLAPN